MRPFLAGVGYEVPRSSVRISHGETIDCVVGNASAGGVGRGNRNVTEEVVSGPRCDLQALVGTEAAFEVEISGGALLYTLSFKKVKEKGRPLS